MVAQAERRLRDASLELGPYGAERQQRAVEMAVRDVQELLALNSKAESDLAELDLAVSQLQEALFGLNRRLMNERRSDQGPLQGLKNTLGSLKDELFADDDWDDWNRPGNDPWGMPASRFGGDFDRRANDDRGSTYNRNAGFRDSNVDNRSQWREAPTSQWQEELPNPDERWSDGPDRWDGDDRPSVRSRPGTRANPPAAFRDDDPWGDG
jgi:molecular chaperone DnaK